MGKTNGGGSLLENLALPSTHPTLHIVMLGLDSAGKTTALYRLKFDQYVNTVCCAQLSHSPSNLLYSAFRCLLIECSISSDMIEFFSLEYAGAHHWLQLRENPRFVGQSQGYPIPSLGCW